MDKTKVGETDADFAVLVNGTYDGTGGEPNLKTAANGGHVQNTASGGASGALTVPADLVFSPNTNGSSPYDFEIEKYDATTGELIAWVQCGVDTAADTVCYVCYGDAGVTTSQESVAGAWDGDYKGVWHMGEASGTRYDSTGNSYDLSDINTVGTTTKIGTAADFIAANTEYLNIADKADLSGGDIDFTIEAWCYADNDLDHTEFVYKGDLSPGELDYRLYRNNANNLLCWAYKTGGNWYSEFGFTMSVAAWHHIVAWFQSSNDELGYTVNGTNTSSGVHGAASPNTAYGMYFGTGSTGYANAGIDEVRFSRGIVRSTNHAQTAYNNQGSPSTFYSMGAEVYISHHYPAVIFQDPGIV